MTPPGLDAVPTGGTNQAPRQVSAQAVIAVLMGIGAIVAIGLLSWSAWMV
jgi:hypothetical protein